jgi:hypothetical protein
MQVDTDFSKMCADSSIDSGNYDPFTPDEGPTFDPTEPLIGNVIDLGRDRSIENTAYKPTKPPRSMR